MTPTSEDVEDFAGTGAKSTIDATEVSEDIQTDNNAYNAVVTLQGLVMCLYEENNDVSSLSEVCQIFFKFMNF